VTLPGGEPPPKAPRLLTLLVTEQCNLNCVYCFEKKKSTRKMPRSVALAAVERHLDSTSDEFDEVQIDFTGGEPLMNFPLIQEVVEHVHARQWRKRHTFSIGTNGTLITEKVRRWADAHPCVTFAFSFDGVPEAHDQNRSKSYKKVVRNLEFFKRWPKGKVKMTLVPESLGFLAASVKHVHALGLEVAANVVFEDVWGGRKLEYLRIFDRQLAELADFYFDNPQLEPPYLVNVPLEGLLFPRKKGDRFCGSGKNMITVDLDGTEYPCHRFLPMASSRPEPKPDLGYHRTRPSRCERCPLVAVCPTCIAYNYECHGCVDHRTTHHCEFIYLQALATAKLQYRKLQHDVAANPPDRCDVPKGAGIKRVIEAIRLLASMPPPGVLA
jgi:sulfatase maturation enzyme AslB (radical SAM superfamily)